MKFIDTHSHIFDTKFDEDFKEAMERAHSVGVTRQLLPAIDSESHAALLKRVEEHPGALFAAMGLHPTSVNDNPVWRDELEIVREYFNSGRRFYAVGEVGLDLYWSRDFLSEQQEALKAQIEIAIDHSLPLIIHTRDAWSEMIELLKEYRGAALRGVFHGYSSTVEDYIALSEMGDFYVGIGGVVTFKKSTLAEVVAEIPLDRILLETDSPYLAPHPNRGKRNEPSYIPLIATKIAQIKDLSIEEVAEQTNRNAEALFGI